MDLSTDFKGAIDVNLNFAFLKFFQDLTAEFGQQYAASMKDIVGAGGAVAAVAGTSPSKTSTVPAVLSVVTPSPASSSASSEPKATLRYVATAPIKLEPQLKAIEGAPTDILKCMAGARVRV